MRIALVENDTGDVLDVIMADPGDPWPDQNVSLVPVPDGLAVDGSWQYVAGQWVAPPDPDGAAG